MHGADGFEVFECPGFRTLVPMLRTITFLGIIYAPFLAVTEVRWGRGSREQSRLLRSEWTSSILSSAAHSAITAVASSVTCKYVEIYCILSLSFAPILYKVACFDVCNCTIVKKGTANGRIVLPHSFLGRM